MIISSGKSRTGNLSLLKPNRKVTEGEIHGEIPGARFKIRPDCEQFAEEILRGAGRSGRKMGDFSAERKAMPSS